ncbi:MAG: hemolysin family protein [Flavobacteriaceae bacterium]|nr:hemolysin family protein [Flavobacteriaceae bacterium]
MSSHLLLIAICLLLSAFFSGMEIAYVSANKIHLELEKKQEGLIAKILQTLTKKPSKFITTMLIGNNIALVIYGIYMGDLLVAWFAQFLPNSYPIVQLLLQDFELLTQTVISTIVILITAEFMPKVFFQLYANTAIKIFALPAYLFYILFWPVSYFVMHFTDFLLRTFFKTKGDEVARVFSKVELGDYISEKLETTEAHEDMDSEIQIFQNALEFAEVKAREVMIPRTEITAVEIHQQPKDLIELFSNTGYSKIIIYKENIDDIIGYVHSFELFKKPKTIKSILLPVEYVPETMLINDVLNALTKKRKSIAVVLDEYGGTSGIMTVEDIIEELFGEIHDEHDSIALEEEQIAENEYLFSARLEVDYLNETYKLQLPESENYETLGGLLVTNTESIPDKGEMIKIASYLFKIEEVTDTKINLVRLQIIDEN